MAILVLPDRSRLRWLLIASILAGAIVARAADADSISVKLVPIKVSTHAYYVQGEPGVASSANEGFNSNAGFVVTGEGVVVIDALGTPALGKALIKSIRTVTEKPDRKSVV